MRPKITTIIGDEIQDDKLQGLTQKKTYIAHFAAMALVPGGLQQPDVYLQTAARKAYLTKLIWNLAIINASGAGSVHNLYNNTTILHNVTIFIPAAPAFPNVDPMLSLLPPAPDYANGTFECHFPGTYIFEGIYFRNELAFSLDFQSYDLANNYIIYTNILVETLEELI